LKIIDIFRGPSTRFFRGSESLFDKARKCPFLVFFQIPQAFCHR
jgi:hypothetical protein